MCIIMHRSVLAFMVYCNVFAEHCNTGTITEGQGHWARAFPAYNEQAPPPCFLRNNIQTHATRWRQKQPETHNYKYPLFVAKLSVCFLQRQSFTCLQFCNHVFCFTSVEEMFCFAGFQKAPGIKNYFPESSILIVVGLLIGIVLFLADYNQNVVTLTPDIFFLFLLPPIIGEAGYFMPNRLFFDQLGTILLMAVVGTIFNMFTIGEWIIVIYLLLK